MLLNYIITKEGESGSWVELDKLSVLIGPNNCGKSQTLRDIMTIAGARSNNLLPMGKAIRGIEIRMPASGPEYLSQFSIAEANDGQQEVYQIRDGEGWQYIIHSSELQQLQSGLAPNSGHFKAMPYNRLSSKIKNLSPESRLIDAINQNVLTNLYAHPNRSLEDEFRKAFKDAFNVDIRLDFSDRSQLYLRVGDDLSNIPPDPRDALPLFQNLDKIDTQGDGFKSFVSIILNILLSKDSLILIDEPEAFLHNVQARILGGLIGRLSTEIQGQVIIATHSAHFLKGLLSSYSEAHIFRLNRSNDITKFVRISSPTTTELTHEPILASQRVVEALFQEGVVVCEADRDVLLYSSVASKNLNREDIFFIQATNKQTLHKVVSLLKPLNIPIAAIADIDVLDDEGTLRQILRSLGGGENESLAIAARNTLSNLLQDESDLEIFGRVKQDIVNLVQQFTLDEHDLEGTRSAIKRILRSSTHNKWRDLKANGMDAQQEELRQLVSSAIDYSKTIGLFIVPVGELESWIPLSVKKRDWPIEALKLVYSGQTPQNLCGFVSELCNWLKPL